MNIEGLWDGPTVYSPYPRRLESLPFADVITNLRQRFLLSYFKILSTDLAGLCQSATCNYYEFWLVYRIVSVLFDWPT